MNVSNIFGRTGLISLSILLLFSSFLLSSPAAGQDTLVSGVEINNDDTAAQIESAIAIVEGRQGLDAETRAQVIELLRDAETQFQMKVIDDAAAERYATALDTSPEETAALREGLEGQLPVPASLETLGINDSTSLAELQQWLAKETAELTVIDSQLAELTAQVETQVRRPALVRERTEQLLGSREELAASVDEPAVAGEHQILTNARRLATQMRRAAQGGEINRLEQELVSHAVRLDLLRAKRDVAARSQASLHRRTDLLRAVVNERQQAVESQARQAAIAAELASADKHPVVRLLAEDNATLAVALPVGAADIEKASAELAEIKATVRSIEQRFARTRQHIEIGGLSAITGRLLIEERNNLPQQSKHRPRDTEIAEVGLSLMYIQEQRRGLTPLDDAVRELMDEVVVDVSDEQEIASIGNDVQLLLRSRIDLLIQAENNYRSYLQVLGELDIAQRQLLQSAEEYEELLKQNLLWIPSAPVIFTGPFSATVNSAKWALSPDSWQTTIVVLGQSLRRHLVAALILLLLLGFLLLTRKPLAAKYEAMSSRIGRLSTDNIGLTIGSLGIVVLRALPIPVVLAAAGWFLSNAPSATAFSDAIAQSLTATAPFLLNVLALRLLCVPDGVFSAHFRWSPQSLEIVRRQCGRLAIVGTPMVFVTVFMFVAEDTSTLIASGQLAFIALMIFLSIAIHPLVQPDSGPAAAYYKKNPSSWISRLRWIWYANAVGVPLLLGLVSALGNVYTSTVLAGLIVDTVWLTLALVIVNMVVLRWLALSRRKLELKILLQKREAQRAEREAEEQPGSESEALPAATDPLDLDSVDLQSRNLLRLCLLFVAGVAGWQIWSEIIPVFSLLDGVSWWSRTAMVDGVENIIPVTMADLLLAILVILVSVIASKNLPGFMEIALPPKMNVEPGSRYAINTLFGYLIVIVGFIAVLNIVGWNWSRIQWLVAALTVGLGFGLQEIVANFVSGIVILFERPIRVGDTITVGQLTGTVSRIRLRATTITDWDRKEIIVPNKSFITEQVVNWTLTDPITRVVIDVGVSYGEDVALVHKVMSEVLPALPLVLEDPAPRVYFSGFGESSLDFKVHVYLRQLTDRMPLTHEVHNAIFLALRENGIEIPFPQRDLHIRSTVDHKNRSKRDVFDDS